MKHLRKTAAVVILFGVHSLSYAHNNATLSKENDVFMKSLYLRGDVAYNAFITPSATTASFFSNRSITATHETVGGVAGYNLGVGYQFAPQYRSDITLTYRPNISFNATDDAPGVGRGTLNNYTTFLNGYYDFNLNSPLAPYVMGGVGLGVNATENIYWPVAAQSEIGTSVTHFVWQVGAGAAYSLTSQLKVDLNYQFIDLSSFRNTGIYNVAAVAGAQGTSGSPTSWGSLYDNQIQLGLRYTL